MLQLQNIDLIAVDCINITRVINSFKKSLKHANFNSVKLLTSQVKNNTYLPGTEIQLVPISPILNIQDYSKFMIKELGNYIDADYVLTVQHDSWIVNPNEWTDEFLKYDYIGAPWYFHNPICQGNGGFAIRSKKLCKFLIEDNNISDYHPEDDRICRVYKTYLEEEGFKFAPIYLASQFSVDARQYSKNYSRGPFGQHQAIFTSDERKKFKQ